MNPIEQIPALDDEWAISGRAIRVTMTNGPFVHYTDNGKEEIMFVYKWAEFVKGGKLIHAGKERPHVSGVSF